MNHSTTNIGYYYQCRVNKIM